MYQISHRGRWVVGAVLVAAAVGSTFAFFPPASGAQTAIQSAIAFDSNQTPAVESAFTSAIETDRQAQSPPASANGSIANAAVTAGHVAPPLSATARDTQLKDGKSALGRHFTPAQAKHEEIGLTNAVNAEANPKFRNLGSGVKKVKFDSIAVSGNTATLRAEVTAWAKFQQQQPDGSWSTSDPVNVMIYNVTMTRNSSGQWMVSSMVGDFAPGEGP